mgnify:CR=1 FL=1
MKRWLIGALAAPLVLAALFLLSAWIGSSVPRNADWREPADGVTIFIGDNGIHTEIVLPLVTPQKDWRQRFPVTDIAARDRPYTHVALSWGERAVFLETPTWADLKPSSALRAATGSTGLVHAAHYVRPAPGPDNRPLRLRPEDYARLVASIERQLLAAPEVFPGYADHDAFYTARGRYHLGNSCNQWTADRLAEAGVRIGLWSPLPGGVMKWVARAGSTPQP